LVSFKNHYLPIWKYSMFIIWTDSEMKIFNLHPEQIIFHQLWPHPSYLLLEEIIQHLYLIFYWQIFYPSYTKPRNILKVPLIQDLFVNIFHDQYIEFNSTKIINSFNQSNLMMVKTFSFWFNK
jgi:hypothetical protein